MRTAVRHNLSRSLVALYFLGLSGWAGLVTYIGYKSTFEVGTSSFMWDIGLALIVLAAVVGLPLLALAVWLDRGPKLPAPPSG